MCNVSQLNCSDDEHGNAADVWLYLVFANLLCGTKKKK